ncbi:hypothetical protein HH215_16675 [Cohnella herbarum]|uniref:Uncharacterized protein n=1 Tax=Cohnella herbarum TaxID=2728023 RepID=A0A7Z2VKD4_9BACL|nr:hypothetical protein HH215_16675 [Cohnella herbarum]
MANVTRRKRLWLAAAICAAAVCAGLAVRGLLTPPSAESFDTAAYAPAAIAMPQGAAWQPSDLDAQGFAVAARTQRYELLVQPATGQVIVKNASSGERWRSNPDPAALENETVGGALRKNLESPFILEYYEQSKVQRLVTNVLEPSVTPTFTAMDDGVAVRFDIGKLDIAFSMLYQLTADGFRVSIPAAGIEENGKFRILSIDPLPFFGAADDAVPGYIFVPDGPGGLIRFPREREIVGDGYDQYVYGPEMTNKTFGPVTASMPVFGLKRGDRAFVAVIAAGEKASAVRGLPSGLVSTLNSVNARFLYREEYNRRLNLSGRSLRVFQEEPLREDRAILYAFLEGEEADYAGMAKRYRQHLLDAGQLGPPMDPQTDVPLHLTLVGGDTIPYGSRRYETATTFGQAEEMLEQLKEAGLNNVRVTLLNWQREGSLAPTLKLEAEKKLGGEAGLKTLIDTAHDLGYRLYLAADLVQGDSQALKLSPKTNGIRSAEGDVLFADEYFFLNPNVTYDLARDLIRDAGKLGADGILYDWLGDALFRDYNPNRRYTRNDTAVVFDRILKQTRLELGGAGAYLGNAYALRSLTDIQRLTSESHKYYAIDETVPFYPMVLHGSIAYSMTDGNLRDNNEEEFLKAIEYGAVPAFTLTAESSRTLMDTKTWGLFASRFSQWKEKLVREYEEFNRLADISDQPMIGHAKRAEGIFATKYANGITVVVDYNAKSFRVEKGGAG